MKKIKWNIMIWRIKKVKKNKKIKWNRIVRMGAIQKVNKF